MFRKLYYYDINNHNMRYIHILQSMIILILATLFVNIIYFIAEALYAVTSDSYPFFMLFVYLIPIIFLVRGVIINEKQWNKTHWGTYIVNLLLILITLCASLLLTYYVSFLLLLFF